MLTILAPIFVGRIGNRLEGRMKKKKSPICIRNIPPLTHGIRPTPKRLFLDALNSGHPHNQKDLFRLEIYWCD